MKEWMTQADPPKVASTFGRMNHQPQLLFSNTLSVKISRLKVKKLLKNFVTFNRRNFLNDEINNQRKFLTEEYFSTTKFFIKILFSKVSVFFVFYIDGTFRAVSVVKNGTMGGIFGKKNKKVN